MKFQALFWFFVPLLGNLLKNGAFDSLQDNWSWNQTYIPNDEYLQIICSPPYYKTQTCGNYNKNITPGPLSPPGYLWFHGEIEPTSGTVWQILKIEPNRELTLSFWIQIIHYGHPKGLLDVKLNDLLFFQATIDDADKYKNYTLVSVVVPSRNWKDITLAMNFSNDPYESFIAASYFIDNVTLNYN